MITRLLRGTGDIHKRPSPVLSLIASDCLSHRSDFICLYIKVTNSALNSVYGQGGLIVWMPKEYLKSISFQQFERNQTSELLTLQMQTPLAIFNFIHDLYFNQALQL